MDAFTKRLSITAGTVCLWAKLDGRIECIEVDLSVELKLGETITKEPP
jgi:hypothetical protein